jgi:peroxiredoxin
MAKTILPLFLALSAWGFAMNAEAGSYAPEIGKRHPDFTLPALGDRKPVSLSDFRGKKVLLLHFASW